MCCVLRGQACCSAARLQDITTNLGIGGDDCLQVVLHDYVAVAGQAAAVLGDGWRGRHVKRRPRASRGAAHMDCNLGILHTCRPREAPRLRPVWRRRELGATDLWTRPRGRQGPQICNPLPPTAHRLA